MSLVIIHRDPSPIRKVELPLSPYEDLLAEGHETGGAIVVKPVPTAEGNHFELRTVGTGWTSMTPDELRAYGEALIELSTQSEEE